jgi:hypothetical protein
MTDIISSVASSSIDGLFGGLRRRREAEKLRREDAAADLQEWLVPVLEELRHLRSSTTSFWKMAVPAIYQSIDRTDARVPQHWRHLKRSIRDCLGDGVGGGFTFLDLIDDEPQEPEFQPLWTMFAADYVEMCSHQVRAWVEAWSTRKARKIRIPRYSDWLRQTDRWHPSSTTP